MACHYRVAAKGVQLGQPEVQVGLIPGAGGTQRLPRLIGLANALEMMTAGNPIDAERGLYRRLIDEMVDAESLVPAALGAANKFISGAISLDSKRTRNRYNRLPSAAELKAMANGAKFIAMSKAKGYLAPFKVIEAVEKGLSFRHRSRYLSRGRSVLRLRGFGCGQEPDRHIPQYQGRRTASTN